MDYRAVFCDIDGTLLAADHSLPVGTAAAVRAVHRAGTPFVLVSARSPSGVYRVQEQLGITGPVVCYGGALILDKKRNPAQSLALDTRRILALKERIRADWPDIAATVYSHDDWFVDDEADPRVAAESGITGATPTRLDAGGLASRVREAHKMFCIGGPDDILAAEACLAGEYPDLAVVKSCPIFLEVMHGGATKANAMEYLCRSMGVPLSEAVAFGDNYNDMDMLEAAGLGVAMGNAPEEVRRGADRVAADSDNEGVARVLEELRFRPLADSFGLGKRVGAWFDRIRMCSRLPKPKASMNEGGITKVTPMQKGLWVFNFEEKVSRHPWTDVVGITVRRWDLGVIDTIGLEFSLRNGGSLIVTEDDMENLFPIAHRLLPAVLPDVVWPADWYQELYSGKDREGRPVVIYDATP